MVSIDNRSVWPRQALLMIAALALLALSGVARAQDAGTVRDRGHRDVARVRWQYDIGRFEHRTGREWVETDDTGGRAEFREVERNADYVELYDRSRDIAVRLYRRQMYLKQPGERRFEYFRGGRWVE
jgi:hypothetical protein